MIVLTRRNLLFRSALVEWRSRYAGSMLGLAWAVAAPLLLMGLYAAVYLFIFQVRVPSLTATGYVIYVLAGLVPYMMTAEAIAVGAGSVLANRDVILNTVFPIELSPVKAVLISQPPMLVGITVVVMSSLVAGLGGRWLLALPVVWVLHVATLLGVVWILSLLNLVVRDIQHVIGFVMMALLIASPFAYTPDMVPDRLRTLLYLNPLAHYVICYQHLLVLNSPPPLASAAIVAVVSLVSSITGSWFFTRMKASLLDYV
jgi:lipopolysaccharide transport system permease protein